jgi:hypothetical protein
MISIVFNIINNIHTGINKETKKQINNNVLAKTLKSNS